MTQQLRVVAIADADSFVKWSASLLGAVDGIRRHLLIVRTPLTVSREQERVAVSGTPFEDAGTTRLGFDELRGWLAGHLPDVVVIAGRAPFVRLIGTQIDRLARRPVVVSGMPGMAMPAQRGMLEYRRHSDLLVVHSRREQRAFAELGERIGVEVPTGLATLPFARAGERVLPGGSLRENRGSLQEARGALRAASPSLSDRTVALAERPTTTAFAVPPAEATTLRPQATDLVFAAQALVPAEGHERQAIADMLRDAAEANPRRRVVVKLRSRAGEAEAHAGYDSYSDLLPSPPPNLVFSYQSMAAALARAEGLVTVSSTAAIEALALGVPVIALDTFGVHKALLNTVFVGSGLLGGAEEVIARRFRHPHPDWLRDNYFHPAAESDWWHRVEGLVAERRAGRLPARTVPAPRGGALHAAWHRRSVLGSADRSALGAVAGAIGGPLVGGILARRRAAARPGADTWSDPSTDFTLEPTPLREPARR